MNALIVDLARVRHAVWLSDFMGMPETRQAVVARQLADARERQHQGPCLAEQYAQRLREQVCAYTAPGAEGGAQ
jgi:F0F1-type ATP synthase membrane subunit b/b'